MQTKKNDSVAMQSLKECYQKNRETKQPKKVITVGTFKKLKRRDENGHLTNYSVEEDEFIKNNYLKIPIKKIARELGRTSDFGIRNRMKRLGLVIPDEIIKQRKKDSYIKKGSIPSNKGKKQSEWMSAEGLIKAKQGQFKRGIIPYNSLSVGQEVTRNEKGRLYTMIKVKENKQLVYKHIWLWEKENGKVKKGYNVIFKDKNPLNCVIDNLECISNQELMLRNSKTHDYPAELIQEYAKISELKSTIKKIEDESLRQND